MNPEKRRARAKRKAKAIACGTFHRTAEGRGLLPQKKRLRAKHKAPLYHLYK